MLTTRSSISRDLEMMVPYKRAGYNTRTPIICASRKPRVEARVDEELVVVKAMKPPRLVASVASTSCLRLLFVLVVSPLFVDIILCRVRLERKSKSTSLRLVLFFHKGLTRPLSISLFR